MSADDANSTCVIHSRCCPCVAARSHAAAAVVVVVVRCASGCAAGLVTVTLDNIPALSWLGTDSWRDLGAGPLWM